MPAAHEPTKPITVGGLPVAVEPVKAAASQSKVGVYAKAVAAFIVTALGAIGAWSTTLGSGPITRNEWIGLAVALAAPFGAASGVAITTNAPADAEAGHSMVEVLVLVVLVALAVVGLLALLRHH